MEETASGEAYAAGELTGGDVRLNKDEVAQGKKSRRVQRQAAVCGYEASTLIHDARYVTHRAVHSHPESG